MGRTEGKKEEESEANRQSMVNRRIRFFQKRYKVSNEFLNKNYERIQRFIGFVTSVQFILKFRCVRQKNRVFIKYNYLKKSFFNPEETDLIRQRKQNVKKWSKAMVQYLFKKQIKSNSIDTSALDPEEIRQQLKEQLEKLQWRESKLIECNLPESLKDSESIDDNSIKDISMHDLAESQNCGNEYDELPGISTNCNQDDASKSSQGTSSVVQRETTAAKSKTSEQSPMTSTISCSPDKAYSSYMRNLMDNTDNAAPTTSSPATGSSNILDILIKKAGIQNNNNLGERQDFSKNYADLCAEEDRYKETDSVDSLLGFEETPGLMKTPVVPNSGVSSAFVSESLNAYMRDNQLETNKDDVDDDEDGDNSQLKVLERSEDSSIATRTKSQGKNKFNVHTIRATEGIVTPDCQPPSLAMPAVPTSLQKLRTVAERRQYLQKHSKNFKLAIINTEATIYRELERRRAHPKQKLTISNQVIQAVNSHIPFTREGWRAAAFLTTEYNNYYYQKIKMLESNDSYKLPGSFGNNLEFYKCSLANPDAEKVCKDKCSSNCIDLMYSLVLKPIQTKDSKTKTLFKDKKQHVGFKPCPLSQKPFQRPLDEETALMLAAGYSMTVVRLPIIQILVQTELGKPLHETARRYLQNIIPDRKITREWAEFSCSVLKVPNQQQESSSGVENEENPKLADDSEPPQSINKNVTISNKSKKDKVERNTFAFHVPYDHDREQCLMRRIVKRCEKLDDCFQSKNTVADQNDLRTNFKFREEIDAKRQRCSENLESADEDYKVLEECADVLSDMINATAISCSEDSFTKEDGNMKPQEVQRRNVGRPRLDPLKQATPSTAQASRKQVRLLTELKRLNATIIDAGIKADLESKKCEKDYCELGCVCKSLADDQPYREHCGKINCMFECKCKPVQQSRIMRFETDSGSISTEDAFMLRQKATARLAPMEKEFTSTIVLTDKETLLINESQYEKKRRCTKVPKRYDVTDAEDEHSRTSPSTGHNSNLNTSGNTELSNPDVSSAHQDALMRLQAIQKPIFVEKQALSKLKHCRVNLKRLNDMGNIAPWCMVHHLYRCFCGGHAVDGKPIVLEKDEVNVTIQHGDEAILMKSKQLASKYKSKKANYSFENNATHTSPKHKQKESPYKEHYFEEKSLSSNHNGEEEGATRTLECSNEFDYDDNAKDNDYYPKKSGRSKRKRSSAKHLSDTDYVYEYHNKNFSNESHADIRIKTEAEEFDSKYDPNDGYQHEMNHQTLTDNKANKLKKFYESTHAGAARCTPALRSVYWHSNRVNRQTALDFIRTNENHKTKMLLREHVVRSVYYTNEFETPSVRKRQQISISSDSNTNDSESVTTQLSDMTDFQKANIGAENDDGIASGSSLLKRNVRKSGLTTETSPTNKKRRKAQDLNGSNDQSKNPTSLTENMMRPEQKAADADIDPSAVTSKTEEQMSTAFPKIVSSYSLYGSDQSPHDAFGMEISNYPNANEQDAGEQSEALKQIYGSVIKYMNNIVSKKMHEVEEAVARESKAIPEPNEGILCLIKWSSFLEAFNEQSVYIWEVKMKSRKILAGTLLNSMPVVPGALGIVNITIADINSLVKLAQFILRPNANRPDINFSLVMQGRASYWVLKGLIRHDPDHVCLRPTPKTHPVLSSKIDRMVTSMVTQRRRQIDAEKQMRMRYRLSQMQNGEVSSSMKQEQNQPQTQVQANKLQSMPVKVGEQLSTGFAESNATANNFQPITLASRPVKVTPIRINSKTSANQILKFHQKIGTVPSSIATATGNVGAASAGTLQIDILDANVRNRQLKSNIEMRVGVEADWAEIRPPASTDNVNHSWLILDIRNDFSHIYVHDCSDLISLTRLRQSMQNAIARNRTVKLKLKEPSSFAIYVTPLSTSKVYFGPFPLTKSPVLILLQSLDGQMICKKTYEIEMNLQRPREERTTAFWVLSVNGRYRFMYPTPYCGEETAEAQPQVTTVQATQKVEVNRVQKVPVVPPLVALTAPTPKVATAAAFKEETKSDSAPQINANESNKADAFDDDDCMIIESQTQNATKTTTTTTTATATEIISSRPNIKRRNSSPSQFESIPPQKVSKQSEIVDDNSAIDSASSVQHIPAATLIPMNPVAGQQGGCTNYTIEPTSDNQIQILSVGTEGKIIGTPLTTIANSGSSSLNVVGANTLPLGSTIYIMNEQPHSGQSTGKLESRNHVAFDKNPIKIVTVSTAPSTVTSPAVITGRNSNTIKDSESQLLKIPNLTVTKSLLPGSCVKNNVTLNNVRVVRRTTGLAQTKPVLISGQTGIPIESQGILDNNSVKTVDGRRVVMSQGGSIFNVTTKSNSLTSLVTSPILTASSTPSDPLAITSKSMRLSSSEEIKAQHSTSIPVSVVSSESVLPVVKSVPNSRQSLPASVRLQTVSSASQLKPLIKIVTPNVTRGMPQKGYKIPQSIASTSVYKRNSYPAAIASRPVTVSTVSSSSAAKVRIQTSNIRTIQPRFSLSQPQSPQPQITKINTPLTTLAPLAVNKGNKNVQHVSRPTLVTQRGQNTSGIVVTTVGSMPMVSNPGTIAKTITTNATKLTTSISENPAKSTTNTTTTTTNTNSNSNVDAHEVNQNHAKQKSMNASDNGDNMPSEQQQQTTQQQQQQNTQSDMKKIDAKVSPRPQAPVSVYGYVHCVNHPEMPRFVTKRNSLGVYMVKIPQRGIFRARSIQDLNTILNAHMAKRAAEKGMKSWQDQKWSFLAEQRFNMKVNAHGNEGSSESGSSSSASRSSSLKKNNLPISETICIDDDDDD